MTLPDGPRQIVAGVLAALVFLALFFALNIAALPAFVLGAGAYGAFLLLVRRTPPLTEQMIDASISRADILASTSALDQAADRIADAAKIVPDRDGPELLEMAAHLRSIRDHVSADPQDYRSTRRFVQAYLPKILESVESYAKVSKQAKGAQSDRLAALGARIHDYGPLLAQIDEACIENDFAELEAQVDALATQLDRRIR